MSVKWQSVDVCRRRDYELCGGMSNVNVCPWCLKWWEECRCRRRTPLTREQMRQYLAHVNDECDGCELCGREP